MKKEKHPTASIRFSDHVAEKVVHRAAKIRGVGPSTFIRESAQAAAAKVIADHEESQGRCATCGRPKTETAAA